MVALNIVSAKRLELRLWRCTRLVQSPTVRELPLPSKRKSKRQQIKMITKLRFGFETSGIQKEVLILWVLGMN